MIRNKITTYFYINAKTVATIRTVLTKGGSIVTTIKSGISKDETLIFDDSFDTLKEAHLGIISELRIKHTHSHTKVLESGRITRLNADKGLLNHSILMRS